VSALNVAEVKERMAAQELFVTANAADRSGNS
jgi:hypothetical protein